MKVARLARRWTLGNGNGVVSMMREGVMRSRATKGSRPESWVSDAKGKRLGKSGMVRR